MVLAYVLLGVLPELVIVLTLDHVATDARNLLHAVIVSANDAKVRQRLASDRGGQSGAPKMTQLESAPKLSSTPSGPRLEN